MSNKVALVTGASRGIGKAIAEYLAGEKYHVVLWARNEEKLKALQDDIVTKSGSANYEVLDVTGTSDVDRCFNSLMSEFGQIDILVNCAGILKRGTSNFSKQDIDELLAVNLNATIYIATKVAQQMKQQKHGYIFNLSSRAGKIAYCYNGLYAASKFGLTGFTQALANEMSVYDVKVCSICPSYVATEMVAHNATVELESMISVTDICKTIAYLLSLSKNASPCEILIECFPLMKNDNTAIMQRIKDKLHEG